MSQVLDMSNLSFDVLIVGAGPGGCAAAFDLAGLGISVALLDRTLPRSKPCAGGLTIKTLRALRYSVAPVIREVCTHALVGQEFRSRVRLSVGRPLCAMTVRADFDDFCREATIRRGVPF